MIKPSKCSPGAVSLKWCSTILNHNHTPIGCSVCEEVIKRDIEDKEHSLCGNNCNCLQCRSCDLCKELRREHTARCRS